MGTHIDHTASLASNSGKDQASIDAQTQSLVAYYLQSELKRLDYRSNSKGTGYFTIDFNFVDHKLELASSWGFYNSFKLEDGMSVTSFYQKIYKLLSEIEVNPKIIGMPYDHPCEEPFETCETHHSYDTQSVEQFYDMLIFADQVFREFKSHFIGKVSPVHLFWHHMDLAVARFSGRKGSSMFGDANPADKEAYSHEVISAGFWAGDENVREPAFYAYAYPSPEGIDQEVLQPEAAYWKDAGGSPMAMLMYHDILKSENPALEVLNFLESTYLAGAKLAKWPDNLIAQHPEKHD